MRNRILNRLKYLEAKIYPTAKVNLVVIKSFVNETELTINGDKYTIPSNTAANEYIDNILKQKRINKNSSSTIIISFTSISNQNVLNNSKWVNK